MRVVLSWFLMRILYFVILCRWDKCDFSVVDSFLFFCFRIFCYRKQEFLCSKVTTSSEFFYHKSSNFVFGS
jgi:hypothetical protein